ncbi:MAG: hypothetical protein CMN74_04000, partial [Sphingorhabdus sp.]|nr:hypothetical protein [Sphingorhabdus sp.]
MLKKIAIGFAALIGLLLIGGGVYVTYLGYFSDDPFTVMRPPEGAQKPDYAIAFLSGDMGFNAAQLFLFGLENLLVVYFAAQLVLVQALSVGMLYAFISYKGRFNNAINTLVSQLIQWRLLRVHLERLADIVHTPAKLESLSTASPQNNSLAPAHKVELRDFSFAYTGG